MCLLWGTKWVFISQTTPFFIVTSVKTSKSYIVITVWTLYQRRNLFPVRYGLGFYIPEDGILHSHLRQNLKPNEAILNLKRPGQTSLHAFPLFQLPHELDCVCPLELFKPSSSVAINPGRLNAALLWDPGICNLYFLVRKLEQQASLWKWTTSLTIAGDNLLLHPCSLVVITFILI
jgi:hypothetical protein